MRTSIESKGKNFLLFLAGILALTLFLLGLDIHQWKLVQDKEMRAFQQMVGGVGMGAVVAPIWNVMNFDTRLQTFDDSNLWPIPGSYSYSPATVSTVTHFKELPQDALAILKSNNF